MAVLYAAKGGSSNSNLYTINPVSGVATSVGAIGFAVTGLTFDPTGGPTLYGVTSNNSPLNPRSLITINTSTGAGTLVGSLGISGPCPDISCNSTGQIYGWADGPDAVLSINKATGAATQIGSTVLGSSGDGMGFDGTDTLYAFLTGMGGSIYILHVATGNATVVAALSNPPPGTSLLPIPGADFDPSGDFWFIDGAGANPVSLMTVTPAGVITEETTIALPGLDALAWSGTKGVFPVPQAIEGVVIAFSDSDTTLERDPTWTRIDQ